MKLSVRLITSLSVNTPKQRCNTSVFMPKGRRGEGRRVQETASSVQPSAPAVYGVETCASRGRGGGRARRNTLLKC